MKTINLFVIGGYGVIIFLTFLASLVSKNTNESLIHSQSLVTEAYSHKEKIREVEKLLIDAETGERGFIITNKPEFLEPYISAKSQINEKLSNLEIILRKDPERLKKLDKVKQLTKEILILLEESIALKKQGKNKESSDIVSASIIKEKMDANRNELEAIIQGEDENLDVLKKNADMVQKSSNFIIWSIFVCIAIIVVVVCLVIVFILGRALNQSLQNAFNLAEKVADGDLTANVEIKSEDVVGKLMSTLKNMTKNLSVLVHQVQTSGIEVYSSSTQIAASGKQLETTITEQVASTNQVVATTKEISATSKKLAKTMEDVVKMLRSTTQSATDSQEDLTDMENSMVQLAEATNSIGSRLGIISEKANNINNIVVTITKVADQTNLLSLNAAIEAEKAGEYGLGFAVVAREIRRLADQTAVATLDIEQMIKEMQSSVTTGVMEMDKFTTEVRRGVENVANIGTQMGQIIEQVQDLYPHFESVNQGMEVQVQGAEQISEAILQLGQTSVQTADSLKEINKAITQLNQVSQVLRQAINRFSVKSENITPVSVV